MKSLFIDFKDHDFILSDNYFDLVPGMEKVVYLSKERAGNLSAEELKLQLKLMSIADTYE